MSIYIYIVMAGFILKKNSSIDMGDNRKKRSIFRRIIEIMKFTF